MFYKLFIGMKGKEQVVRSKVQVPQIYTKVQFLNKCT